MSARAYSISSVAAAVLAIAIMVIPFVGPLTAAVLSPAGVALGAVGVSRTKDGGPNRKLALLGLTLGLVALLLVVLGFATGEFSERAR